LWVTEVALFAFTCEPSIRVNTVGCRVACVGAIGALISWSGTVLAVSDISLLCPAFAGITIWQVGAISILVTVVRAEGAFVDGHGTDVSVTDVSRVALAFVAGGYVQTVGVAGAFVHFKRTFVDLLKACPSVSVVTGVAYTLEPTGLAAILGLLWFAYRVNIAIVDATGAIVWLDTSGNTELVDEWQVHGVPIFVALFLHFCYDSLECVRPVACGCVFGIIDQFTAKYTSVLRTCGGTFGLLSELAQLRGDHFPVVCRALVVVGRGERDGLELLVGKGGVLGEIAFAVFRVVWMCTFVSLTARCILVSGVA
jgi:hypothetical protein